MITDADADGRTGSAGWRRVTLGDVIVLQRGKDLPLANRSPGTVPVIGSNGTVGMHDEHVHPGPGVLVGRSGSVGKVSWSEGPFWPLNTALWVKDFKGNDPRFVYYLLSDLPLASFAAGVSVPTLNRNLLHPIEVSIPPLEEQRRIARVLSTIQQAQTAEQRVADALGSVFHSALRGLVRGAS
jgi:type I restriction enzyme, S subunit